jgi:hypothetical protein
MKSDDKIGKKKGSVYVSEENRCCHGEGNTKDKNHNKDIKKSTGSAQTSRGLRTAGHSDGHDHCHGHGVFTLASHACMHSFVYVCVYGFAM